MWPERNDSAEFAPSPIVTDFSSSISAVMEREPPVNGTNWTGKYIIYGNVLTPEDPAGQARARVSLISPGFQPHKVEIGVMSGIRFILKVKNTRGLERTT